MAVSGSLRGVWAKARSVNSNQKVSFGKLHSGSSPRDTRGESCGSRRDCFS